MQTVRKEQRILVRHTCTGASVVECLLTFPLLFGLVFGLVRSGSVIWQSQRVALVAQELGREEFERCFRNVRARNLNDILNCLPPQQSQQSANSFSWPGVLALSNPEYRGTLQNLGLVSPTQAQRVLLVICMDWAARINGTQQPCSLNSDNCTRMCDGTNGWPTPPLDTMQIVDPYNSSFSASDELKLEIWSHFGELLNRRGFLLFTEIASGVPGSNLTEQSDIFEASVL